MPLLSTNNSPDAGAGDAGAAAAPNIPPPGAGDAAGAAPNNPPATGGAGGAAAPNNPSGAGAGDAATAAPNNPPDAGAAAAAPNNPSGDAAAGASPPNNPPPSRAGEVDAAANNPLPAGAAAANNPLPAAAAPNNEALCNKFSEVSTNIVRITDGSLNNSAYLLRHNLQSFLCPCCQCAAWCSLQQYKAMLHCEHFFNLVGYVSYLPCMHTRLVDLEPEPTSDWQCFHAFSSESIY